MQVIKITDYNAVTILERKDNFIYFRWNDSGRTHRAKVQTDSNGREYFKSYNLQIGLEQEKENKYYIACYTGGGGMEYTRIFDNTLNHKYAPFESREEAQAYIDSGELNEYVYEPSYIIYTKIITAAEKEKYSPDYRNLWKPVNKYPRGPFMGISA